MGAFVQIAYVELAALDAWYIDGEDGSIVVVSEQHGCCVRARTGVLLVA